MGVGGGGEARTEYVVETAEDMPVPQLYRRALQAFIAAQQRRGVHRQPIEIVPRLCLFTLGFHSATKHSSISMM